MISRLIRYAGTKSMFVRKSAVRASEWISRKVLDSPAWRARLSRTLADAEVVAWLDTDATTVRRFQASGEVSGVPVLFSVQNEMAKEELKPLTPSEREMKAQYSCCTPLHTLVRARLVKRLEQLQVEHRTRFTDISDVFAHETGQASIDCTHLSSRGAEVAAIRFAKTVFPAPFGESSEHRLARGRVRPSGRGVDRSPA